MGKRYHYFYKVEFPTRGWFYYGIHSTNNLNDKYCGSPKTHRDKWVNHDWEFIILQFFDSRESLEKHERNVLRHTVKHPLSLNVQIGTWSESALLRANEVRRVPIFGVHCDTLETYSFDSVVQGEKELGVTGILQVLGGRNHHVRRIVFRRQDETTLSELIEYAKTFEPRKYNDPIKLRFIPTNEIREFDSMSSACEELNLQCSHLSHVLSGKRKHHKQWTKP